MWLLCLLLFVSRGSGAECTVADCTLRQKELLERIFALDWSGNAGEAALEAEAQFQSRAIVPLDWVSAFDDLFGAIKSLLRRCVLSLMLVCGKAEVLELMRLEQRIETLPGDKELLRAWGSNRSDNSFGSRVNVAQRSLIQTLRRERQHFANLPAVCMNANCSDFFGQSVSRLDGLVMRAVQGVKPFSWSQPESSAALLRFTTRRCVEETRPFLMCWPELAMRWLRDMSAPTMGSYVLQMDALTPINTSMSNDFVANLMTDVEAREGICFGTVVWRIMRAIRTC